MLIVLSPAKKLDFESDWQVSEQTDERYSQPVLLNDAEALIEVAQKLSAEDLKAMMGLSDNLANLNIERFKAFQTPFTASNARPAIDAFKGDVYLGLDAPSMSVEDREYAQKHIRILSGLYGVLKPLDLMQAYRLEMGTRFQSSRGVNLYQFWDEKISQTLNHEFATDAEAVLINLASNEYFKAVKQKGLKARVITPIFKDIKDGKARVVSFLAKKARGMMARYVIDERINQPEALKNFNVGGYNYNAELSDELNWVYTRPQPAPARG